MICLIYSGILLVRYFEVVFLCSVQIFRRPDLSPAEPWKFLFHETFRCLPSQRSRKSTTKKIPLFTSTRLKAFSSTFLSVKRDHTLRFFLLCPVDCESYSLQFLPSSFFFNKCCHFFSPQLEVLRCCMSEDTNLVYTNIS